MKFSIIAAIFFIFSLNGFTQEKGKVKWYSFEEAVKLNEKNPKKLLIDVYTDWCGWCKKMKKQTFNNSKIAQYINENYYPVRFNAETNKKVKFKGRTFSKKEGEEGKRPHDLAIALLNGKMSYPSVAYLDGKNELITAVPGYYGPKDYEPILKYFANDIYKTKSFEDFKEQFENTLIEE
ncbi:MAG: thioredoxin family protein [Bacteroidota bacterium]